MGQGLKAEEAPSHEGRPQQGGQQELANSFPPSPDLQSLFIGWLGSGATNGKRVHGRGLGMTVGVAPLGYIMGDHMLSVVSGSTIRAKTIAITNLRYWEMGNRPWIPFATQVRRKWIYDGVCDG